MQNDLYQPPESELETVSNNPTAEAQYVGPQSRSTGEALDWIQGGFSIFKQSPGAWVLTMFVGFIVSLAINLIPIIGSLITTFTSYVWIAGFMIGCDAVAKGGNFEVKYLFAGFTNRLGALICLCVIYIVLFLVIFMGTLGTDFIGMMVDPNAAASMDMSDMRGIMLRFLIAMALIIPVAMALWFAPVLIVLQQMSVVDAMKASFSGCAKNILPFLVYGLVFVLLYILGALPLLLGLLVVVPMFFGSMYTSYQRIYLAQ